MEATSDIRRSDLLAALLVAAFVLLGSVIALRFAGLGREARAPAIDPGLGTPVRVTPVLDTSKGSRGAMPKAWRTPKPRPPRKKTPSETTHATASEPVAAATPRTSTPTTTTTARKKASSLPSVLPDVSPEPSETPAEAVPPVENEPPSEPETPGSNLPSAVDEAEADENDEDERPGDPNALEERAIGVYRTQLTSWFKRGFEVHGTGLSDAELTRLRGRTRVELAADQSIVGFSITPSGNAAFDDAVRKHLETLRDATVPRPPDEYPDAAQKVLNVTFTCPPRVCT